jgi:hypothetical protein
MSEQREVHRDTPPPGYRLHARFHVRFTLLGPRWIEGRAGDCTARGSTEDEVIDRLAEQMEASAWEPPRRQRPGVAA